MSRARDWQAQKSRVLDDSRDPLAPRTLELPHFDVQGRPATPKRPTSTSPKRMRSVRSRTASGTSQTGEGFSASTRRYRRLSSPRASPDRVFAPYGMGGAAVPSGERGTN